MLNVQRLFLGQNSKLLVKGNDFILNCAEIVADPIGNAFASIELGASNDIQQRSFLRPDAAARRDGADGAPGVDGAPPTVESTPLGVRVVDDGKARPGGAGGDGASGLKGRQGRNGAMLYLADLRFGRLTGFGPNNIHIRAQAGAGFDGAPGGNGGNGGRGGAGSDGLVTPFGVVSAHAGGSGGRGGAGGDGGKGGSGGLNCGLFVSAPAGDAGAFLPLTLPSPGGKGGAGGKGGSGGKGGPSGRIGAIRTGVADDTATQAPGLGPDGANGSDGQRGLDGKSREAPTAYVFQRR